MLKTLMCRLLGAPQIRLEDGPPLGLGGKKNQALLFYLVVTGQPQTREALADLLWPDRPERQAKTNLRAALPLLRRALGNYLSITRETVALNRETPYWLDVDRFHGLLKSPPGLWEPAAVEEAIALYRGEFLEGFFVSDAPAFEDWVASQRAALHTLVMRGLEMLIERDLDGGDDDAGLSHTQRLLALDPWHEGAHRQRMVLLVRNGRRRAALAQYETCCRLLADELGIEPMVETTALYERIRNGEESRAGADDELSTLPLRSPVLSADSVDTEGQATLPRQSGLPPPRPMHGTVVGRQLEVDQLRQRLGEARQGLRQMVFVSGEAGSGKTTLVEMFLRSLATEDRLRIGRGQCIEHYGEIEAYFPVFQALEQLGRAPGGDAIVAVLRRVAPTCLTQLPALISESEKLSSPRQGQGSSPTQMLRELAATLEALTTDQLLVLVLEDLHWSDPSTIDFIAFLARWRGPVQLLLLGTYRPAEAHVQGHPLITCLREIEAQAPGAELRLSHLTETDVAVYGESRLGGVLASPVTHLLHERSAGNALCLVHLVEHLIEQGLLTAHNGYWQLRDEEAARQALPTGIRELLTKQLEQLPPAAQPVVEAASVMGEVFSSAAVAAALQCDIEAVDRLCVAVSRLSHLLRPEGLAAWPDGTVSGRYRFEHELMRQVASERLEAGPRMWLHRRIGERLETGYGDRTWAIAATLAVHFTLGRDALRALPYLRLAAQTALQRGGHEEARTHCNTGLTQLVALPESPNRTRHELQLQMTLGAALIMSKGYTHPGVVQAHERAQTLCQQLGDDHQHFAVLRGLWFSHTARGQHQAAYRVGQQLLSVGERLQDPSLCVASHAVLGESMFHQGKLAAARDHLEAGLSLADPSQPYYQTFDGQDALVCSWAYHAWALWYLGFPTQAQDSLHTMLGIAEKLAQPYGLTLAQYFAAQVQRYCGHVQATQLHVEAALAHAKAYGFVHWAARSLPLHGWVLAQHGQWDEARKLLDEGLAAMDHAGTDLGRPWALLLLADVCRMTGKVADGLTALTEALACIEANGERYHEAELHRLRGELLLQQTPLDCRQAEQSFQNALATARRHQLKSLELRAALSLSRLWRQQGKRREARDLLTPVFDGFTEGFDTADLIEAKALVDELSAAHTTPAL